MFVDDAIVLLPKGYSLTIRNGYVNIYCDTHKGEVSDDPTLIFSSDCLGNRRVSYWSDTDYSDEEEAVLKKVLKDGWGFDFYA